MDDSEYFRKIHEVIKDQIVYEYLGRVDTKLAQLPPNGAENHRRDKLRQKIIWKRELFEDRNETFEELAKRDRETCLEILDKIVYAKIWYGISL